MTTDDRLERITVRLSDALRMELSDVAKARGTDVSSVVRQAVRAYLDGMSGNTPTAPPPHDREACAQAVLEGCWPWVRQEVLARMTRVGLPLANLFESLLTVAVEPVGDTATQQGVDLSALLRQTMTTLLERAGPHAPEDCCRIVLAHCPPAVQARMAEAQARTGATLLRLLPGILHVWTDATGNPRAWTPDR